MSDRRLQPVVLTSSSTLRLADLFSELKATHRQTAYELFLLREPDIAELAPELAKVLPEKIHLDIDNGSSDALNSNLSSILAESACVEVIFAWLLKLRSVYKVTYRAIASYLPDVSSLDPVKGSNAKRSLINLGMIARRLRVRIVEMVAGTLLDCCSCPDCQSYPEAPDRGLVHEAQFALKLDQLMAVMSEVLKAVPTVRFALEMEPGDGYVLNRLDRLQALAERILTAEDRGEIPSGRLGFNLDIGHMRIGNISARQLRTLTSSSAAKNGPGSGGDVWKRLIFHAHISDAPGMHTRDLGLGQWTPISTAFPCPYDEYLRLLQEVNRSNPAFSGAVSVELEGCSQLGWLHQSLANLRNLIARV